MHTLYCSILHNHKLETQTSTQTSLHTTNCHDLRRQCIDSSVRNLQTPPKHKFWDFELFFSNIFFWLLVMVRCRPRGSAADSLITTRRRRTSTASRTFRRDRCVTKTATHGHGCRGRRHTSQTQDQWSDLWRRRSRPRRKLRIIWRNDEDGLSKFQCVG